MTAPSTIPDTTLLADPVGIRPAFADSSLSILPNQLPAGVILEMPAIGPSVTQEPRSPVQATLARTEDERLLESVLGVLERLFAGQLVSPRAVFLRRESLELIRKIKERLKVQNITVTAVEAK